MYNNTLNKIYNCVLQSCTDAEMVKKLIIGFANAHKYNFDQVIALFYAKKDFDIVMTFEEWNKFNCRIVRGEKGLDIGNAKVFDISQVYGSGLTKINKTKFDENTNYLEFLKYAFPNYNYLLNDLEQINDRKITKDFTYRMFCDMVISEEVSPKLSEMVVKCSLLGICNRFDIDTNDIDLEDVADLSKQEFTFVITKSQEYISATVSNYIKGIKYERNGRNDSRGYSNEERNNSRQIYNKRRGFGSVRTGRENNELLSDEGAINSVPENGRSSDDVGGRHSSERTVRVDDAASTVSDNGMVFSREDDSDVRVLGISDYDGRDSLDEKSREKHDERRTNGPVNLRRDSEQLSSNEQREDENRSFISSIGNNIDAEYRRNTMLEDENGDGTDRRNNEQVLLDSDFENAPFIKGAFSVPAGFFSKEEFYDLLIEVMRKDRPDLLGDMKYVYSNQSFDRFSDSMRCLKDLKIDDYSYKSLNSFSFRFYDQNIAVKWKIHDNYAYTFLELNDFLHMFGERLLLEEPYDIVLSDQIDGKEYENGYFYYLKDKQLLYSNDVPFSNDKSNLPYIVEYEGLYPTFVYDKNKVNIEGLIAYKNRLPRDIEELNKDLVLRDYDIIKYVERIIFNSCKELDHSAKSSIRTTVTQNREEYNNLYSFFVGKNDSHYDVKFIADDIAIDMEIYSWMMNQTYNDLDEKQKELLDKYNSQIMMCIKTFDDSHFNQKNYNEDYTYEEKTIVEQDKPIRKEKHIISVNEYIPDIENELDNLKHFPVVTTGNDGYAITGYEIINKYQDDVSNDNLELLVVITDYTNIVIHNSDEITEKKGERTEKYVGQKQISEFIQNHTNRVMEKIDISLKEPVCIIDWSENGNPELSDNSRHSLYLANSLFYRIDKDVFAKKKAENSGGYDKTSFRIIYHKKSVDDDNGIHVYEGRYDLGDTNKELPESLGGTLLQHISDFADYSINHLERIGDVNNLNKWRSFKEDTLKYFDMHCRLSTVDNQILDYYFEQGGKLNDSFQNYRHVIREYIDKSRITLNDGRYDIEVFPDYKDFGIELKNETHGSWSVGDIFVDREKNITYKIIEIVGSGCKCIDVNYPFSSYLFENNRLMDTAIDYVGNDIDESISELQEEQKSIVDELNEQLSIDWDNIPINNNKEEEIVVVDEIIESEKTLVPVSSNVEYLDINNSLLSYQFSDTFEIPLSPSDKLENNLLAIKTLKNIETEKRLATKEEQEILASYVGWGGLADAFDEKKSWSTYSKVARAMTDDEYKAARESVLSSFYTPKDVAIEILNAINSWGYKGGAILEPSCGIGNFFSAMPNDMKEKSRLVGVEIDSISGRIARQLQQNAKISITGYEKMNFDEGTFDLVVGNVPFGNFGVVDTKYSKFKKQIHDYFFMKAIDNVASGGLIAFISSTGTLDKKDEFVRQSIANACEFVGAIRMPRGTFSKNANTLASSDIIFLKKRETKKRDVDERWIHLGEKDGVEYNQYFIDHPDMMLGRMVKDTARYGEDSNYRYCVNDNEGFDIANEVRKCLVKLNYSFDDVIHTNSIAKSNEELYEADESIRDFSYALRDGKVVFRHGDTMGAEADLQTGKKHDRIIGMIPILSVLREIIEKQQLEYITDDELDLLRAELNKLYDEFVKKYGYIHDRNNRLAFSRDIGYVILASLENEIEDENGKISYEKSDIFFTRTSKPHVRPTQAENALDALNISLYELGEVNFNYIISLYQPDISDLTDGMEVSTEDEYDMRRTKIIDELGNAIFLNPMLADDNNLDIGWEPKDVYLSGNVKEKLKLAEEFSKNNSIYQKNVVALTSVQPTPLSADEITVSIGLPWVRIDDYNRFMYETFETASYKQNNRNGIYVDYNGFANTYKVVNCTSVGGYDEVATSKYGTKRANAYQIFEDCLNQKITTIYDYIDTYNENGEKKQKRVLNKDETLEARTKQEEIKNAFEEWIFDDLDRRNYYEKLYNDVYNSNVNRTFDGSYFKFDGMCEDIKLLPHQKNAIARIVQSDTNTLLAHAVGAGKTFEMIAGIMESKRLGKINKALMVVPNSIVQSTGVEFIRLYPNANVLIATKTDFEKSNRREFMAKIASGNFDAIIMATSQFEKLKISPERQARMIEKKVDELTAAIAEMKEKTNGKSWSVKQMEANLKSLKNQLSEALESNGYDNSLWFEDLGVDCLVVDEAHNFKNLNVFTKINDVAGIQTSGSNRATDLEFKISFINEINKGRGVVFATGTPVSNTLGELYVMMHYLYQERLRDLNLEYFDNWVAEFGKITSEFELAPEGSGYRLKNRLSRYHNVPELMNIYRDFADIQTSESLSLPNIPKLENDKYIIVESKITDEIQEKMDEFVERAELIHAHAVDSKEDNMLKITHEGRLLGTDIHLLDPDAPYDPDSKLNKVVENVYNDYVASNAAKGTQIIFSDIGTPKYDYPNTFTVYEYVKDELIKKGIPENEIAFIHDVSNDKTEELYRKVRKGEVRVLMGSSDKCGTGVNVQNKLVSAHHIDCPWKPSAIEQREGRILRQGNENKHVKIYRYVTSGTFDAYSWALVETKQKFISQIMTTKNAGRNFDDADSSALSYAEIKAVATGDPRIKESMELKMEVDKLKRLKSAYRKNKFELEKKVSVVYPSQITHAEKSIEEIKKDIELREKNNNDSFSVEIKNNLYDDKEKAGALITSIIKSLDFEQKMYIGTYRGFKLRVYKSVNEKFERCHMLELVGNHSYKVYLSDSAVGNFARLDNMLEKLDKELERLHENKTKAESNLEIAKTELDKPFPQEEELFNKITRLNELENELCLDKKDIIVEDESINANESIDLVNQRKKSKSL